MQGNTLNGWESLLCLEVPMLVWIVTCHTYITTHLYTRKWAIGEGPFIWVKIPIPCEPSPTIHTQWCKPFDGVDFPCGGFINRVDKGQQGPQAATFGGKWGAICFALVTSSSPPIPCPFEKFANMVSSKTICCDAPIK